MLRAGGAQDGGGAVRCCNPVLQLCKWPPYMDVELNNHHKTELTREEGIARQS